MDKLDQDQRSYCMSRIRGRNTKPELIVRSIAHNLGYRYQLHYEGLPGKPDLVFSAKKKVIFVHGCFWHRHNCKKGKSTPATNTKFWVTKLNRNKERDKEDRKLLRKLGWKVLVVWECQTKNPNRLFVKLNKFLA